MENIKRRRKYRGNRRFDICIIGVWEGEEKEDDVEVIFEKIMVEKFLEIVEEVKL